MNNESLSHEVIKEVIRLGGKPGGIKFDDTDYNVHQEIPIPNAIRELFSIEWPNREKAHYSADHGGHFHWAQHVFFHSYQYCGYEDFGFEDRGDKELVSFCHAKGSYFIMIDLNDPTPSDPLVYHVSSARYSPQLGDGILMSIFLSKLDKIYQ